jgi:glycosyltransferase involved in cell wall biosynthesis
LKILIVTQQKVPFIGGLSTHIEVLIKALTESGHELRLVQGGCLHSPKWLKLCRLLLTLGNRDKFNVLNFKALLANLTVAIEKQIFDFKPDLIHSHDVYASYCICHSKKPNRIPFIHTMHGPALFEAQMGGVDNLPAFKRLISDCELVAFKGASLLITPSTGHAQILQNLYQVHPDKVRILINCVDLREVDGPDSGQSVSEYPPFFLVPRRLVKKDGVRHAVEAMAHIDSNHSVKLLIAGNGPMRVELENLSEELGVSSKVKFLGCVVRRDLLPLYKRAAAIIIPSIDAHGVVESSSIAAIEGMASGSVVIASRMGGLEELIEDDITGMLVPPGDPKALAQHMMEAVNDQEKMNDITRRARRKVEECYSKEIWVQELLEIYNQMVHTD